jgi:TRAP-type C4-dicarboxylate transport system permease small subunit
MMHGLEDHGGFGASESIAANVIDTNEVGRTPGTNAILAGLDWLMGICNRVIAVFAAIALIAACLVLSHSMLTRSLFKSPTYWQDEAAVFLLVGATFMTAAFVQSRRGHIGIEAMVGLLSPRVNHIRLFLVDVASCAFCTFFAWKSWTLTHEAWVDGQVSNSMWSPPLAIPYALMSTGMTLLCIQLFLQIWGSLYRMPRS